MQPRRPRRAALAALVIGLVLAGCRGDGQDPAGGAAEDPATHDDLLVVATTSILGDVTAQLLGEAGEVEVVIPPGSDPHGYEASARDAATLREADLVVANGLQLEEGLQSALDAAAADGARVLEVAPQLDPIAFDWDGPDDHGHDDHDHDDHDHDGRDHDDEEGHDHGPQDPHVWHDPLRMIDAVELIAGELVDVAEVVDVDTGADRARADELEARADAYEQQLRAVHDDVESILAEVPDDHRQLITSHDSFGYLAVRYDFEVIGTVIPGASTDAETDPAAFSGLVAVLEEVRVPAVFSESIETERLSDQLASEVLDRADLEVEVVELYSDSLGEPGSDAETYLDMVRANAERIAAALS